MRPWGQPSKVCPMACKLLCRKTGRRKLLGYWEEVSKCQPVGCVIRKRSFLASDFRTQASWCLSVGNSTQ